MYYVGIDGGGTKTKFLLTDERMNAVRQLNLHGADILNIGQNGLTRLLRDGMSKLCAGLDRPVAFCCAALPCYTEVPEDDKKIETAVAEGIAAPYYLCNDVEAGWAGSLGCMPGINVVAGTGSIAYGVDENGKSMRSGGWGHILGDEGSAHWISRRFLEIYTKQKDGRLPKTLLCGLADESLGLEYPFAMLSKIVYEYDNKRDKVASLSRLAFEAALRGDQSAIDIFDGAAYELALHVRAIMQKLSFKGKIPVSYSGGVFNAGQLIIKPFRRALDEISPDLELITPMLEPCQGMAYMAYLKHTGTKATKDRIDIIKSNLENNSKGGVSNAD